MFRTLKLRRLRLTTKDVNKGYYKGTGTGSMGRHTKHGGYIIDWNKVRTYVCPPLEGFKVSCSSAGRRELGDNWIQLLTHDAYSSPHS